MVRLKVKSVKWSINLSGFQFLYGAIKSWTYITNRRWLMNFNSSMVRLKVLLSSPRTWLIILFQFLYGAIKRALSTILSVLLKNFNSSMVRLKGRRWNSPIGIWQFQFLYGAIKSNYRSANYLTFVQFQFLYGAIKSVVLLMVLLSRGSFQFLYGAIKSLFSKYNPL